MGGGGVMTTNGLRIGLVSSSEVYAVASCVVEACSAVLAIVWRLMGYCWPICFVR